MASSCYYKEGQTKAHSKFNPFLSVLTTIATHTWVHSQFFDVECFHEKLHGNGPGYDAIILFSDMENLHVRGMNSYLLYISLHGGCPVIVTIYFTIACT